jgi:hypothetical protein
VKIAATGCHSRAERRPVMGLFGVMSAPGMHAAERMLQLTPLFNDNLIVIFVQDLARILGPQNTNWDIMLSK